VWIERNQPLHFGLLCFGKSRSGSFRRGLRVAGVTADLPGQRYSLQLQQLPNCISQYRAGMSLGPPAGPPGLRSLTFGHAACGLVFPLWCFTTMLGQFYNGFKSTVSLCASPSVLAQLMVVIASSQALINFCAISGSDTSVIACIPPARMVADATSRIEKKQWELTALTTIQKQNRL
jgi:hypothetical protein